MRRRPAARLIVLDPQGRVLLFRFRHREGALAGQDYWATPGGAVESDESFTQAARRELLEETGIAVDAVGPEIAERRFVLQLTDGERVLAEERFFLVRAAAGPLSHDGWTEEEVAVMVEHRWWPAEALRATRETVYPEGLAGILAAAAAMVQPARPAGGLKS